MNAHQQWLTESRHWQRDHVRELPRDDFTSAQFADRVDRIGSVIGWIIGCAVLVMLADWVVADMVANGWRG